ARRPLLLLATSYDTAERSLGAASSAAPVAAMLETLRILQAGAPLENDVAILFGDGERVGGLGMRAFAGQHALAKRVGLVMRFDGGGSAGPVLLIGASGNDRAAISGWAHAAPNAHGSSAMQAVYRTMPGAPEMGALGTIGTARLHFANMKGNNGAGIGSRDTVARLDPATVQSMGETMTALARHFGRAPPDTSAAGETVYFTLPLIGAVSYAASSVWMLTRLACLMFLIVCWMAVHRGDTEPGAIANGAVGFILISAILMLAAFSTWQALAPLHPGYNFEAYGAGARDGWFMAGVAALCTALFVVLQRGFRRAVGFAAAALGPLTVMVLLLLAASWKMPGASYLLVWPLMGTLLAYGALYAPLSNTLPGYRRALIQFAGVTPAVVLIAPLVSDVFFATSPENLTLPIAALALLLGMATLLLTAQRRFIVRGLAAVGVACIAVAGSAAPYGNEPMPQPNRMVYLKDAYTWKSYWLLPDMPLDGWTRQFFPGATHAQVQVDAFGYGSPKMWLARAPRTPLGYPDLAVLKDDDDGNQRAVEFTLHGKAEVPFIDVTLSGADAYRASVNGRVLTNEKANTWTLSMYGMGDQR
ncbi:MAG TPA: M28 family peptidase, partial [Telluria sp.]|nr:M28 family peptidase [Telluria sp.]